MYIYVLNYVRYICNIEGAKCICTCWMNKISDELDINSSIFFFFSDCIVSACDFISDSSVRPGLV